MKIFLGCMLAALSLSAFATGITTSRPPFQNLAFPIDSVSHCQTYSQLLQSFNNNINLGNPIKSLTFYAATRQPVKSVVESVVMSVSQIGNSWVVITKNDQYYFTYTDLANVTVKKGDFICANTVIGSTGYDTHSQKYCTSLALDTEAGECNPESIFKY